jgi:predicted transposase/invertase (TIGR01784 family)
LRLLINRKNAVKMAGVKRTATGTKEAVDEAVRAKYINPLTDFGFKHIFGEEASMLDFLNAVLNIEGGIKKITYINTEKMAHAEEERIARYDLHCITGTGERIIIEMQNQSQFYFKDRMLYYATFPIQEQAPKGTDWNFKLSPVYSVNITNFCMDKIETVKPVTPITPVMPEMPENLEKPYCSYFQLMNTQTKEIFSDKLIFAVLELPLFNKTENELKTGMDKWMFVLKNLPNLNDLPAAFRNEVFEQMFKMAEIAKLSAEDRRIYYSSLKSYWDMNNYFVQKEQEIAGYQERETGFQQQIFGYQQQVAGYQQEKAAYQRKIAELEQQLALNATQEN